MNEHFSGNGNQGLRWDPWRQAECPGRCGSPFSVVIEERRPESYGVTPCLAVEEGRPAKQEICQQPAFVSGLYEIEPNQRGGRYIRLVRACGKLQSAGLFKLCKRIRCDSHRDVQSPRRPSLPKGNRL